MESNSRVADSSDLMVIRSQGWLPQMRDRYRELLTLCQGSPESLMPSSMAELAILTIVLTGAYLSKERVVEVMNRFYNYDWLAGELNQAIEQAAANIRSL